MSILAAIWFAGTFALTIFVPNRSSLYALLPSVAPALVAGFLLQQLWDAVNGDDRRRRLVAAAVSLPVLLLPVYWTRNMRWTEIAELSSDTFAVVRRVTRERPDVDRLIFRDDRSTRRSFADDLRSSCSRKPSGSRPAGTSGSSSSLQADLKVRLYVKQKVRLCAKRLGEPPWSSC